MENAYFWHTTELDTFYPSTSATGTNRSFNPSDWFAESMRSPIALILANGFVFDFCFSSPVRRLDQPQASGGLGEHCLSSAVGHVLCAPLGRVAQPRLLAADRGNPEGGKPGSPSFGLLFLGDARKSDQLPVCHRRSCLVLPLSPALSRKGRGSRWIPAFTHKGYAVVDEAEAPTTHAARE